MAHVSFIHGIGNKTPADTLGSRWLTSLADYDGLELEVEGVSSSMAYWADFMCEAPLPMSGEAESLEAVAKEDIAHVDMDWRAGAMPPRDRAPSVGFGRWNSERRRLLMVLMLPER